jgi:hypothetical protein
MRVTTGFPGEGHLDRRRFGAMLRLAADSVKSVSAARSVARSNAVLTTACANWKPLSEFVALHNQQPKPFVWTKTADTILSSIGRFAPELWLNMVQTICKKSMTQETSDYLIS